MTVYPGNGIHRTDLHTWMRHTALTLITYFVDIVFTGIACRWDNLHQRRFIIFLINRTFFQPLCYMNRSVLRAERHTHSQPDPLTGNRSFAIYVIAILRRISRCYFVGNRLYIIINRIRIICYFCNLHKYLLPQSANICL